MLPNAGPRGQGRTGANQQRPSAPLGAEPSRADPTGTRAGHGREAFIGQTRWHPPRPGHTVINRLPGRQNGSAPQADPLDGTGR